MLELRFIRENLTLVKEKCAHRGLDIAILDDFAALDGKRRAVLAEVEGLKNKRNTVSDRIAVLKKGSAEEKAQAEPLIVEMRETNQRIKELDGDLAGIEEDLQKIVAKHVNDAAMKERTDVAALNAGLQKELADKGMTFNQPQADSFRDKLRSGGFYAEWKGKYGDEAWAILEKAVGKLA